MKEVTLACEAFEKLLKEQLNRIANMNCEKTDFSTKETVVIGVIDGDGIGPIITQHATRVLKKLLADEIEKGLKYVQKYDVSEFSVENMSKKIYRIYNNSAI